MGIILLFVMVVLLFAVLPTYGYSRSWGYRPSGLIGILLVGFLVLLFIGMIPWGFSRPVYYVRPVYVAPRPVEVINPPPVRVISPPAQPVAPPAEQRPIEQ